MLSIDNASDYIIRQIYFSGNLTGPYDNTIHVSNHCFRDRSKDFRLIPDAVGENWCAVPLSGTGLTFIEYSSELHIDSGNLSYKGHHGPRTPWSTDTMVHAKS